MIQVIPIKSTKIIDNTDSITDCLINSLKKNNEELRNNDLIVIAETVISITEGRQVELNNIKPGELANHLAKKYTLNPKLTQLIIDNADSIIGGVKNVLLTIVKGNLIANAGIDQSNSGGGSIVKLWPENPYNSARKIRNELMKHYNLNNLGVIISDSHVNPMRQGVIGSAIGIAGFKPVNDCVGRKDLFGHVMKYSKRAIADQTATAAHLVMGECDEQTPFVIARGINTEFTNEPISHNEIYMPANKCLFINAFKNLKE